MDREFEPINESHIRQKFTMSGDKDYAHWLKTFPDPMPSTHTLAYRWTQNEKGQAVLIFGPELKGESPEASEADELTKLSDGDLATIAAEEGVKVTGKMTKAQVIAAIVKKRGETVEA